MFLTTFIIIFCVPMCKTRYCSSILTIHFSRFKINFWTLRVYYVAKDISKTFLRKKSSVHNVHLKDERLKSILRVLEFFSFFRYTDLEQVHPHLKQAISRRVTKRFCDVTMALLEDQLRIDELGRELSTSHRLKCMLNQMSSQEAYL